LRLIQEAADQELIWRQPSAFKEQYELRAGDEVLATLHWQSAWGTLATARTAEGEWTFKRSGFWQQRIGVRPLGSEREVATFVPDWSGNGILTIEGERTFRWVGKGFWGLEKLWQERADAPPLIGFKNAGALKTEARVVLSPVAASLPETTQLDDLYAPLPPEEMAPPSSPLVELPLLVTLGFYLMVLASRDAAAAAATT
jgi:hypothetical protein